MKRFTRPFLVIFGILIMIGCEKENIPPTCEITSPQNGAEYDVGDLITISVEAEDEDGTIEEVRFYIDDMGISSATSFPYSYQWNTSDEAEGIKKIKVYAKDDRGATVEDEISILLKPGIDPPVAAFTADKTTIIEGESVQFTDQSTNEPTSWSWSFGDGGTSTIQNPSHTFTTAGTYTIMLTATNDIGSDAETKTNYITVEQAGSAPVAAFKADKTTITEGESVQFTDQSTNEPTSWSWDFGDGGGTNSVQNPSHTYSVAGNYTVSLQGTNQYGTDTETKANYITVTESGGGETEVVEVTNPATGKTWMDRNLGASQVATSSTDADSYGDLYQWGRGADGHEKRNSGTTSTLSSSDTPGHGNFFTSSSSSNYDWRSPQNDNLWQGLRGTNNPCPSGYRLPTEAEWEAERQSWGSNNAAGAFASPLKLPMAGWRSGSNGSLGSVGSFGYYWSSTVDGASSRFLFFSSNGASMFSDDRAYGYPVRCLKD